MNSRPGVSAGPPFSGFVHLIFALVTTSIGWIIIGTGLFAGGFIWGLNSHQVSYVAGGQGVYDVYSAPGFYYLHQENTSNDYAIKSLDFSPNLVGVLDGFGGTAKVPGDFSFIASPDTIFVHYVVRFGPSISFAHPIEKFTFDGTTSISTEYQTHPNGYTINNWLYASLLMLVSILCVSLSFFFLARSRKRQKLATAAKQAELDAIPSPFAHELAEDNMQSD